MIGPLGETNKLQAKRKVNVHTGTVMARPALYEHLQTTVLLIFLTLIFRFFALDNHERVKKEMGSLLIRTNVLTEPELVPFMSDSDYDLHNDEGYYD